MQNTYQEALVGARFLARLPAFLRQRISADEARSILRCRLQRREADFLSLARRAIYSHSPSPWRHLLGLVGCEYGDLERFVWDEGLEAALKGLYRQGVYLTVDELKGRRPAVRGSTSLIFSPNQLHNPIAHADLLRYRSGSRGGSTPVPVDLVSVGDRAVNLGLALAARGGIGWQHGFWEVPGGASMVHLLEGQRFGAPPARWFSQLDPAADGLHPRYRWSARLMRLGSVLAGVPLPCPTFVPLDNPLPIVRWMAAVIAAGGTPHLKTYASSAVRLCQAASAEGIELRGVQLTVSGEPATEARMNAIRAAGAAAVPRCGSSEAGLIGYGCLAPEAADELHVYDDLNAFIQPGSAGGPGDLPPRSLLLTSLRPSARLILLNVSLGDQADLAKRACGCPLQALGWTTHLSNLRSYEKLTAGGMTFLDTDVIRVLEDVLPARFGGGPIDYQLLEEQDGGGRPRVRLLVHPRVGLLDEAAVGEAFLAAIGSGSGVERVMALQWRTAGLFRVDRACPRPTAAGKILHLHSERPVPAG